MTTKTKRTRKPYKVVRSGSTADLSMLYIYEATHAVTGETVRFRVERLLDGDTNWGLKPLLSTGEGLHRRWSSKGQKKVLVHGKRAALSAALKTFCEVEH